METRMVRLKQKYDDQVVPAMKSEFGYKNSMQVPKLEKITINVGLVDLGRLLRGPRHFRLAFLQVAFS